MCLYFYYLYRLIDNKCYFHSQVIKKEDILSKFRRQEYNVLFTTTILERGITLSNLQVIVLFSNHYIFNTMNLIKSLVGLGEKKYQVVMFIPCFKNNKRDTKSL